MRARGPFLILLLLAVPLSGCSETPCIAPSEAAAVFEQARGRLAAPLENPATATLEGTLRGTPLDLVVASDPAATRLSMQGTIRDVPIDVRLDGPWESMRVGGSASVGRDHAPGSGVEALLDRYLGQGLPYTQASVDAHAVACIRSGGRDAVQFLREDGNERDVLVVEHATPHRILGVQHVGATSSYRLTMQHEATPPEVDTSLPRRAAKVSLDQVDYEEDPNGYAFRWSVGNATWVPTHEIQVAVLDANNTPVARTPLNASTSTRFATHDFVDHAPRGLLSPGDVLTVAIAHGHTVTLYDAWADQYVDLTFT